MKKFKSHIDGERIFDAYCKRVLGNKLMGYEHRENRRKNNEDLYIVLNKLAEDKCKIILLYYYDKMTGSEIAESLDLPRTTVQYKRRTALDALYELISGGK